MTNPAADLLHVVQIGFFNDPEGRSPAQLLEAWNTLVDVAEAVSLAGVRMSVVQACAHRQLLERNGVQYHFLPFGESPHSTGLAPLGELLHALAPHVLHVNGLDFPRQFLSLMALAPGRPVVFQDHASRPPRIWRRPMWRRALAAAAAIVFCAKQQAEPFARAGLLAERTQIYEIPESTSRFTPGDRLMARSETGLCGDPAVLWVGHLDANKDPLTVLDGISAAARVLPNLRLWCCFGVAPLLRAVEERIAGDRLLCERVQLVGRVPHQRIEQLMRAADIFVLGSRREGSGYALIESLACGLPPVVADIPSFRALTGGGAVGRLWPCGNSHALCAALLSLVAQAGDLRAGVRAHFERELSLNALGRKLAAVYQDVILRASPRSCDHLIEQHNASAAG